MGANSIPAHPFTGVPLTPALSPRETAGVRGNTLPNPLKIICVHFIVPSNGRSLLLLVHDFRVNHAFVLLFLGLRLAAFRLRLAAPLPFSACAFAAAAL